MTKSKDSIRRFSYKQLSEYPWHKYEFYYPFYRFTFHKLADGVIVGVSEGHRIYECHPDNSQYLFYNYDTHTSGTTNRFMEFFHGVQIDTGRKTLANGKKQSVLTFRYQVDPGTKAYRTQTVTGEQKYKIEERDNRELVITPIIESASAYVKDNAKYREFNKQLAELRAVLVAQTKMGVYDEEMNLRQSYGRTQGSLIYEVGKALGLISENYIGSSKVFNAQVEFVDKWIKTRDTSLLRSILLCCLHNHTANVDRSTRDNVVRRIKNGLVAVQRHYLRKYCVKIVDSSNSLSPNDESDDQNCELLPSARLREVQVPREAQVC